MSKCDHRFSRSFLGPMPKRALDSLNESYQKRHMVDSGQDEDHSAQIIANKHAFSFFLSEGGRPEDWNERMHKNTRTTMMHRWRESEWGKALNDYSKENKSADQWIGGSFEIGRFLGLDIVNSKNPIVNGSQSMARPRSPLSIDRELHSTTANNAALSDTALLSTVGPSKVSNPEVRYEDLVSSSNVLTTSSPQKIAVRVAQHGVEACASHVASSDLISRPDSDANVSVGTSPTPLPLRPATDDSILRDRMLVRIYYSDTSLPSQHQFNEEYHRTARDLEYKAWGEFLVVLRKNRIELYEDYGFPVREWLSGHKRYAFSIPLSSNRTRLSIYSLVDLTFSVTYSPKSTHKDYTTSRWIPFLSIGSKFFIFKLKSRSRAYDWVWKLWLQLKGRLPSSLEVKSPALSATVTIDVPKTDDNDVEKFYDIFNRENLIRLSVKALNSLPDWASLVQRELACGKKLALSWRVDANLDWIWLDTDVNNKERKWAALCGLVAKDSLKAAVLEIRLAEHYPTHIHLKDGNKVDEPPGIEGYLQQIHPNRMSKYRAYLATHDGNLFVLSSQRAYPPSPPGFLPHDPNYAILDEKPPRQAEIWRGALQIMHASGVCDLRNILAIRRAFQPVPAYTHNEPEDGHDDGDILATWSQEEASSEDDQDEGGENGGSTKPSLSMRRSFELSLKNGHVIRYEAYSSKLAIDWINRLRSLVSYWKVRHRYDAQNEMELAQASKLRLTPQIRSCGEDDAHAPLKLPTPLPMLVTMYTTSNWCMLEECRPIVRGGKLFMRKGLRGQYMFIQMFLVANHLTQYGVRTNSLLHPVSKKICLSDAYVCSGYLAVLSLPEGEFDPSSSSPPRRYQDGLEASDRDEDTIFMLCYRPPSRPSRDTLYHTDMSDVPSLSKKRKTLMFRTRSKLERDAWCWAINCEIERTVRMQREREEAIRNSGNLMPHDHTFTPQNL